MKKNYTIEKEKRQRPGESVSVMHNVGVSTRQVCAYTSYGEREI